MKPELEQRIFGYIDPESPIPGSWKAEVFRLMDEAEAISPELVEPMADSFAAAVARMDAARAQFFDRHFGIFLGEIGMKL